MKSACCSCAWPSLTLPIHQYSSTHCSDNNHLGLELDRYFSRRDCFFASQFDVDDKIHLDIHCSFIERTHFAVSLRGSDVSVYCMPQFPSVSHFHRHHFLPTVLTVTLMLQCCVRLSSVCPMTSRDPERSSRYPNTLRAQYLDNS